MSSGSFADDAVERNKGNRGVGMDVLCLSCRFSPSCLGHSDGELGESVLPSSP